jgi:hypothetical protein
VKLGSPLSRDPRNGTEPRSIEIRGSDLRESSAAGREVFMSLAKL